MNKFVFALALLLAGIAYCGATSEMPKVFFVGGGGSVRPAATNAVLEAAYAYTDNAISNTLFYVDWELGSRITSDGVNFLYPNSPTNQVLAGSTAIFLVSDNGNVKALPMFEVYSPADTPVYVASTEDSQGTNYSLVFTCETIGQPIDFKLIITLMPYEGVSGTASRIIVFNLRRTF